MQTLYEEVAFVAYHFHWAPEVIVNLEHMDRIRWVKEISAINERVNNENNDQSSFNPGLS
ncbi:MAG TPA: DUF6760 family protein [Candidatus Sulfotelmatobacter sp.]|nr:DUF6760 family protein [Candidatus Sulfotelmatobacter sp.]